jgi:hypothetical protein
LIVSGIKDIENRNWLTNYRDQLYIHASKRLDVLWADLLSRLHLELKDRINTFMYFTGGLIGYVNLVDCVTNHPSEWFHGKYGFVLNRPQPIDFYPMKGQLSIFDFDFSVITGKPNQEKQLLLF